MQVDKNMLNPKDLYPIYGLWHKPFWQTTAFYVIVISVLSFLILLISWFLIKKYLRKKYKKMAWQKALSDIDELKKLLEQNKVSSQGFYLSLTEIIKRYLFGRYGYDLFGKTDVQVIQFLEENKFNPKLLESMKIMSQSMELIKFAKASTVKEVMEKDIARSIDLINKTIPTSDGVRKKVQKQ